MKSLTADAGGLYHITSLDDFVTFRRMVNAGNNFSGKTVKLDTDINWDDMMLHADNPTDKLISTIAIYIDLEYLNSLRVESYGGTSDKVLPSDPNRVY